MGNTIPGLKIRLLIRSNCCVNNIPEEEEEEIECQPEESTPDLDLPPK
jgi:hypothetical protein